VRQSLPRSASESDWRAAWEQMMATKPDRAILIAGGGIGGLSAALGLAQKGRSVIVLEKAPSLGEIGAGIQLGPNAFHCFDNLGVGEAARAMAVYIDKLRLMDAISGEEITHIDLGEAFRARFKNPYAVVHRGDLHGVLLKACRNSETIDLRVNSEVVSYDQDDSAVTVRLGSGEPVVGAALIGADGLWSNVRKQVVGDGAPRVSGHTTYRSVIPTERMPEDLRWNAATLWAGPKCHLVHYPLSGWKVFNLVVTCHNDAPEPVAGKPVSRDEVMKGFAHVNERAQKIIQHGSDWKLWVLCDREPVENWVDGRVALLGDAAHPMLQYMAQGACMAMEDAVCLSHVVAEYPGDLDKALEAYRSRRVLRTARVQLQSRAMGDHVYHPAGAHAALRNAIMRSKSSEDWYADLAWLYGGTGLIDQNFN
jgi:3-hydroxybenzoate 6-monooxygenase